MTEQQQEQAIDFALGEMSPDEQTAFEAQIRENTDLRAFVHSV